MEKSLMSEKLRSVITLVDRLRDIQLQQYITLPKIVAVGSQSSGKSSLVEQIVGLDFLPRGSGVVTRRPLQLRMIYQKDLIKPYGVFAQIPNKKFTDFQEVKSSIEMLTDKVCGKSKNIVDNPIILDVYSRHCPNLTIIDLPGLTRIAIQGQDQNIHQITTNMIKKYMMEPSTIILCVIPANQDITNDQVLYMARKIDPEGERTLGCITKIDIMDRGTDVRNLLLNKGEVNLKLGFIGIKNRSQADINQNKTVQQSLKNEKDYFSKSPIYSSLPPSCLGTTSLVNHMTKILTESIVKFLPQLISRIKQRKSKLAAIVKQYGKPLPKTNSEKQSLIWELCSQFINEYNKSLLGHIGNLNCGDRLLKLSTKIQDQLSQTLQEQFNSSPTQTLSDNKIYLAIRKFEADSMPGFPSIGSFIYLLNPLLNKLKFPLEQLVNTIYEQLLHITDLIITQIAHEFIGLREHIKGRVAMILNKHKSKALQFISQIIDSQVGYIYTNNPSYEIYMNEEVGKQEKTKLAKQFPIILVLRKRVNAYYRVVVQNIRDLIPKNVKYTLLIEASKKIEFEVFQTLNSSDRIDEYLKIGENSKKQRIKNETEYDIICKAEQFLLTHASFASYREAETKKRLILRQQQIDENNKKRTEKQAVKKANMMEEAKRKQELAMKQKQAQKAKEENKTNQTDPKSDKKKKDFLDFFKSEDPVSAPKKQQQPVKIQQLPKEPPKANKSKDSFAAIFGEAKPKAPEPKNQYKPPTNKESYTDTYNREMGKATDGAVDTMFANKEFQKKSKEAVGDGASLAAQKQLGVSEDTGKTIGKGAAWLFGTDAVQNHVKEQTKKNLRSQTQFPKK